MSNIPDNIFRDGTSQKARYTSELKTANVLVDGRDMEYFLTYVAKLAAIIRFYDLSNSPFGEWDDFFPKENEISQFISRLSSREDLPPQIALMVAFLRLMDVLKQDINQLSREHLNFYYQKVLQFQRHKAIAEKANVVFEPANNIAEPFVLPEDLELLAGKAENGSPIIFTTDKELTVSKFQIAKLSSILVDELNESRVYAAPKADSADGIASPLPKEGAYWSPFGESQVGKAPSEKTMIEGKAGFAVASIMFLLREGQRQITLTVDCKSYRISHDQFDALRTTIADDSIMQQLEVVRGVFFESADELQDAIIAAIGAAKFATHSASIFDHINHPLKLVQDADLEKAFVLWATGEKDWLPLSNVTISKQADSQLRFQIKLDVMDPPIVDFDPVVHKEAVDNTLPMIQVNLNHANTVYLYEQLRGIKISNVSITLDVKGVTNMALQGDNGPVNPSQPFLPFGPIPAIGSNFYFGSREIFSKNLTGLQIELSWANLPNDNLGFQDYYKDYTVVPTNNSFTAQFSILDRKKWKTGATPNIFLFRTDTSSGGQKLLKDIYTIDLSLPAFGSIPLPEIKAFDPGLTEGFGRLMLNAPDNAFGHAVFPKEYADRAVIKVTSPGQPLPNPPYTPKISHFAVNYTASFSFAPSDVPDVNGSQVFHVEPFGLTPMNDETSGNLLPQFAWGSFFIGLNNIIPPQNISILFQMADGGADPDVEVTRDDVKWNYFDRTKWKPFNEAAIQIDTTFGLQTSGIIEFSMPNDISDHAPFWANGLFWLKAEFYKNPSGSGKIAILLPNAMEATLQKDLAEAGILKEPLAAESISKLINTNPAIKTVRQPFSSFGGSAIEPEFDFNRRVSERLRHKNRAVNLWDYEHLVLEAFPSIYKTKCLPHTGRGIEAEPGSVTLLVIPDLRKRNKINPFQPKVSPVIRGQVAEYLRDLKSEFSTVYVDNPKYEQILVEMSVGLLPGFDGNFYGRLLNEELRRFLSPWAYEEGQDIVFGGRIFKSNILSFVEQREYVDYVTNFKLYHIDRGLGIGDMRIRDNLVESDQDFIVRPDTIGEEVDFEIVASSSRSILVTAADHNITVLSPGEFVCPEAGMATGIGAMIIEVDFFVF
ncbi:MAG TPA: baseplate J/gp47 family protein [Chitinophagaceae bacterium]|nr:baseplate J/gp47 family protein [Chitinophagaceae bacterium]